MPESGDIFFCEEDGGIFYVIISNHASYDNCILAWPVLDSKRLFVIVDEKDLTIMEYVANIYASYPVDWDTDPSDLETYLKSSDSPINLGEEEIIKEQDQLGALI